MTISAAASKKIPVALMDEAAGLEPCKGRSNQTPKTFCSRRWRAYKRETGVLYPVKILDFFFFFLDPFSSRHAIRRVGVAVAIQRCTWLFGEIRPSSIQFQSSSRVFLCESSGENQCDQGRQDQNVARSSRRRV